MKYTFEDFLKVKNAIREDDMEITHHEGARHPIESQQEFEELYHSMKGWIDQGHEIGEYENQDHFDQNDLLAMEHMLMTKEFGKEE